MPITELTPLVEYSSDIGTVRRILNLLLGALIAAFVVLGLGCAGGTEIQVGQLVTGTITDSDDDDGEWKSQTYVLEVQDGVTYSFELSSFSGGTIGIWNEDANGYIVEVSPAVDSRSKSYTFSDGGSQKLYLQSPKDDVPSDFSFTVTVQ